MSRPARISASNGPDPAPELIPDRNALTTFVNVLFKNADNTGFVSFRIFRDNGQSERPVKISAYRLDDYEFYELMLIDAEQAARWSEPAVFAPPVCTFKNQFNAKTDNIFEGVVLTTECDQAPYAARATLEALLGPATIVGESGGEWINADTGEVENKAHLHWRLKKAAGTREEIAMLHKARRLATMLVGGDASAIPIVHPLRWPGSWHRKGTPKLARIAALNEDAEIDLEAALEQLEEAAEAAGIAVPAWSGGAGFGQREAPDASVVAQALAIIPNDSTLKNEKGVCIHDWEYWNKVGMTIWVSTGGSEEGRETFHDWSAKAAVYDQKETDKRWDHYAKSPPTKLGFGSLVYLARQHQPGWRYVDPTDAAVEAAIGELLAELLRMRDGGHHGQ